MTFKTKHDRSPYYPFKKNLFIKKIRHNLFFIHDPELNQAIQEEHITLLEYLLADQKISSNPRHLLFYLEDYECLLNLLPDLQKHKELSHLARILNSFLSHLSIAQSHLYTKTIKKYLNPLPIIWNQTHFSHHHSTPHPQTRINPKIPPHPNTHIIHTLHI